MPYCKKRKRIKKIVDKKYKIYAMSTDIYDERDVHYAYDSIDNFFYNFELPDSRCEIESILTAALSDTIYKKERPAHLLYFMDMLEKLCSAAFVIHYSDSKRRGTILEGPEKDEPDMSAQENFLEKEYSDTVWQYFPRSLTARQYHNPYRAIKKFCKFMVQPEWQKVLKELTEYALSDSPIDEIYPSYNILTVRKHLLQLIEACFIIRLRSQIKEAGPDGKKKKKNSKK